MDAPTRHPLLRLVALAFALPQILMGAIFAGLPAYAFVVYWWPAFERYCRGAFSPDESAVVLFGALVFGGFFFVIGAVMLVTGLRSLVRIVGGGDLEPAVGQRATPEEIAAARRRVMGFPRLARLPRAAVDAVQNGDAMRHLLDPVRAADGFYELRSRPVHWTLGLALLAFGAFWNAVVLVGLTDLVRWSLIGLVFAIFLLPFVLVGIALLAGAAYFLSALLHPELTIRLRVDPERRTLEGSWSFARPPSRLRVLTAVLKVSEKHVQGSGEDQTTKSIPVLEHTLVEGANLLAQDRGGFSYRWPDGLELPRRSGERQVDWTIHVRAASAGPLDFRFWVPVVP